MRVHEWIRANTHTISQQRKEHRRSSQSTDDSAGLSGIVSNALADVFGLLPSVRVSSSGFKGVKVLPSQL